MSNTIRQSNLFSDFDWRTAYEAFRDADFKSYTHQAIFESMVEYIKKTRSDEFNDFILSSELIAHVNMLAFLGQSLAYRTDINSKENFIDDATRRESIINLASTLTYKPKRNTTSNGFLKISSVSTTETLLDSDSNNLANRKVFWNQKGDNRWYDNFIKIITSAFSNDNKFGFPFSSITEDGISKQFYRFRQPQSTSYVYPFTHSINGEETRFEVVPSIVEEDRVVEDAPSISNPMSVSFFNSGKGMASPSTGFFVQFKQGELQHRDFNYSNPKVDRSELIDVRNVNNTDVWVQNLENGIPKVYWEPVDNVTGQNIIYNDIFLGTREIFFVKSHFDDMVEVLYGDGNFSKAPLGDMRVWVRSSKNDTYKISKGDINNVDITIPYISVDGKLQKLTLTVTNVEDIDNSKSSESIDEIRSLMTNVHYNQDRMVTVEDYNLYPLGITPTRKLLVRNRDNSSNDRYTHIEANDPTGHHSNSKVEANDGYLYDEYFPVQKRYSFVNDITDIDAFAQDNIEPLLQNEMFKTFVINTMFIENFNASKEDYSFIDDFPFYYWNNVSNRKDATKGNLFTRGFDEFSNTIITTVTSYDGKLSLIRDRSKLLFQDRNGSLFWTTVIEVNGWVRVSDHVPDGSRLIMVVPSVRKQLGEDIKSNIANMISSELSFGLRYDLISDKWYIIEQDNIIEAGDVYKNEPPSSTLDVDNRWLVRCMFERGDAENTYNIITRGQRIIFGSDKIVRYFFTNTDFVRDIKSGVPVLDNIDIKYTNDVNDDGLFGTEVDTLIYQSETSDLLYIDIDND